MADEAPTLALAISRPERLSPHWRKHFLEKLAATSDVTTSAQSVGASHSMIYRALASEADFAAGWKAALEQGYRELEMELLRRLRSGDMSAQANAKFDFANAIRFLSFHREKATSKQSQDRFVSPAEVRASIDRKIEDIKLRSEQFKQTDRCSS